MFDAVLCQAREYLGPYALNIIHREMSASVFYTTDVVQLPPSYKKWVSSFLVYLYTFNNVDSSLGELLYSR
jgi:hypothetical protein